MSLDIRLELRRQRTVTEGTNPTTSCLGAALLVCRRISSTSRLKTSPTSAAHIRARGSTVLKFLCRSSRLKRSLTLLLSISALVAAISVVWLTSLSHRIGFVIVQETFVSKHDVVIHLVKGAITFELNSGGNIRGRDARFFGTYEVADRPTLDGSFRINAPMQGGWWIVEWEHRSWWRETAWGTTRGWATRAVRFPFMLLLVPVGLLGVLPWVLLVGSRSSRRRRRGLCERCGYDLSASEDRCPECGHTK